MKTAIVTGASTGIGRATAIKMAASQYYVFLVARNIKKLKQTQKMISDIQGNSEILPTDLSKIKDINNLIKKVKSKTKKIHVIANIAGIWHNHNQVFADTNYQDFDQGVILETYTVGFTAPSLLIHGLLPLMPKQGKIVNLSGTFENGAKGWLPYYASKRALEDLTIGLSQELEEKNIQVNCISPSDTATEEYEKYFSQYIDEAIDPNKIAQKIVELCKTTNTTTGKVIVMQKGKKPFESFHH